MRLLFFIGSLMLCSPVFAWSNHTLVTHQLVASMPEVAQAKKVTAESLDSFLLANEEELEGFLDHQERRMRDQLWYYAPRPDELAFKATGNRQDIRKRFAYAIRINPHSKLTLYLQHLPGEKHDLTPLDMGEVSTLSDPDRLPDRRLGALSEGIQVAPLAVVSTASVEPDYGLDIGLFSDSNTDYGKIYGFGKQPFGNPNLPYSTQAPFHMGFYHESVIVYSLAGFLRRTYPEYRIQLYKQLAEFAFARGHDYWGWRFMGWGLHYIGDFSNPYHVMPMPGANTVRMLKIGMLNKIGFPDAQKNTIQLASNRHAVLEDFQNLVMTRAYETNNIQHPAIQALTRSSPARTYQDNHPVTVISRKIHEKAHAIHTALEQAVPPKYVNDPAIEYSDLEAKAGLLDSVRAKSGQNGHDELVMIISDLLGEFAESGASYVESILKKSYETDAR